MTSASPSLRGACPGAPLPRAVFCSASTRLASERPERGAERTPARTRMALPAGGAQPPRGAAGPAVAGGPAAVEVCSDVLPPVEALVAYRPLDPDDMQRPIALCQSCVQAMVTSECELVRSLAVVGCSHDLRRGELTFTPDEAYRLLSDSSPCLSESRSVRARHGQPWGRGAAPQTLPAAPPHRPPPASLLCSMPDARSAHHRAGGIIPAGWAGACARGASEPRAVGRVAAAREARV